MIPILYGAQEREYATNGLGRLADAISCVVTEERNGQYELAMRYPVDGVHYSELAEERQILARPSEGARDQPFRIYRIDRSMDHTVTVYAQHVSYMLKKVVVAPFSAASAAGAMELIGKNAVGDCPFTFWTDKNSSGRMSVMVPTSCRALLGGSDGSVLDSFGGGEYEFDRYEVKLYASRGRDAGVTIRYGKNLTSLETSADADGAYTSAVPYWRKEDDVVVGGQVDSGHSGDYAYQRCVPMDLSYEFEEAPTKAQLEQMARERMEAGSPWRIPSNTKISFIPLYQTEEYREAAPQERVGLCDVVTIAHEGLGVSAKAKVVRTDYDVLMERYDSIEVGDARGSLAQEAAGGLATVEDLKENKSWLERAVEHATKLITGGLGGYVLLKPNANGEPEEILVMDTKDINTARRIWRWNMGGLGYSENGYEGPFGLAITMDGSIVADYVKTGTLMANLIKAGVLASLDNDTFYLDLENGILRMKAQSLEISGKTVDGIADEKAQGALRSAKEYADGLVGGALDDALTQEGIFNKLTDNGAKKGLYMEDNELYVNATFIKSGTLVLGGVDNRNGALSIRDASDREIGRWDKDGIMATDGSFSGDITGATGTFSGQVLTDNGTRYACVADGALFGGTSHDGYHGYLSFDTYYEATGVMGARVAAEGCVAIFTPHFGVGDYVYEDQNGTFMEGQDATVWLPVGTKEEMDSGNFTYREAIFHAGLLVTQI